MRPARLRNALGGLKKSIAEVDLALEEVAGEHDPLAHHIFVSRRRYRRVMDNDTKSGRRSQLEARFSWQAACDLGYRGSLGEWARLMGAFPKR